MDLYEHVNQIQEQNTGIKNRLVETPAIAQAKATVQNRKDSYSSYAPFELTNNEMNVISQEMANSAAAGKDPSATKEQWTQAIMFSRYYGLPLSTTINNLDSLSEYQLNQKPQYTQTWTRAVANSFTISSLSADRSNLAKQYHEMYYSGQDTTEIGKQLDELDQKIADLTDYTPRNILVQALKAFANSATYSANVFLSDIVSQEVGGAAIDAASAAVPAVAEFFKANPWAATIITASGGFLKGYEMTKYSKWYDLVKEGVDPEAAEFTSSVSSVIQATIESFLGIENKLARGLAKGGADKIAIASVNRMFINGSMDNIAKGATKALTFAKNYGVNMASEFCEEFSQQVTDMVFDNIAYAESDMDDKKYTASNVLKESLNAGIQGALAAAISGVSEGVVSTNNAIENALMLKRSADTSATLDEFKEQAKVIAPDFVLEKNWDSAMTQIWEKAKKQANEIKTEASAKSIGSANVLASGIEGAEVAKDTIVFTDEQSLKENLDSIKPYATSITQADDGSYKVTFKVNDGFNQITYMTREQADQAGIETVKPFAEGYDDGVRFSGARMTKEQFLEQGERKYLQNRIIEQLGNNKEQVSDSVVNSYVESTLFSSKMLHMDSDKFADKLLVKFDTENTAGGINYKGYMETDGNNMFTIHINNTADVTTLPHEIGHVVRRVSDSDKLSSFAKRYNGLSGATWVEDIKQNPDGTFSVAGQTFKTMPEAMDYKQEGFSSIRENEEKFVNEYLMYQATGVAPDTDSRTIFERMANLLKGIYDKFEDKLDVEAKEAFDNMLKGNTSNQANTENQASGDSRLYQTEEKKYKTVEEADEGLKEGIEKLGGVKIDPKEIRVNASTVKEVYDLANAAKQEFSDTLKNLQETLGLKDEDVSFRSELKSFDRIVTKTLNDYDGDVGRVLDVNGATFTLSNLGEARTAFDKALKTLGKSVVRSKGGNPTGYGYTDFKINLQTSNGFIGELILLDQNTAWMKNNGIGHDIYEEGRKLEPYLKKEDNQFKKYQGLFGINVWNAIDQLNETLAAWSRKAYENAEAIKNGQYDNAGFSANLNAVSLSITELSNQLRSNFAASYLVGSSSITPFGVDLNILTSPDAESLLNGVSQISKYLTDIDNSSTSNKTQNDSTVNATVNNLVKDAPRNSKLAEFKDDTEVQKVNGTLVVTHGLSQDNLKSVVEIGGMPMPSLAINTPDLGNPYGEVVLVGDANMGKDLIKSGAVYDRDLWSPRVPTAEYSWNREKVNAFEDWLKSINNLPGMNVFFSYSFQEAQSPAELARFYAKNDVIKVAYCKENGIDIEIPYEPQPHRYDIRLLEVAKKWGEKNDFNLTYDNRESLFNVLKPIFDQQFEEKKARVAESSWVKALITQDKIYNSDNFALLDRILNESRHYTPGKEVIDQYKLKEILKDKAPENKVKEWMDTKIEGMYINPRIRVGKKKLPYSAENILQAMTKEAYIGNTFGGTRNLSWAKSNAASQFSSREEMAEDEKFLGTENTEAEERLKKANSEFMDSLPYHSSTVESFVYTTDAAFSALADLLKRKNRTEDAFEKILKKNYITPNEKLVKSGVSLADAIFEMQRYYFEAKPKQVMQLSDFTAALVPKDVTSDTLKTLKDAGLDIVHYADDRTEALKNYIDNSKKGILFQLSDERRQEILDQHEQDVENAVSYGYIVPSKVLQEYADKPWAEEELAFRKKVEETGDIARRALKAARASLESENKEDKDNLTEYNMDSDHFVDAAIEETKKQAEQEGIEFNEAEERPFWTKVYRYYQTAQETPEVRNRKFAMTYARTDEQLLNLANRLKNYLDVKNRIRTVKKYDATKGGDYEEQETYQQLSNTYGAFKGVSTKLLRLTKDSTQLEFADVRDKIISNPAPYREALDKVMLAEERVDQLKYGPSNGMTLEAQLFYQNLGDLMDKEFQVAEDEEEALNAPVSQEEGVELRQEVEQLNQDYDEAQKEIVSLKDQIKAEDEKIAQITKDRDQRIEWLKKYEAENKELTKTNEKQTELIGELRERRNAFSKKVTEAKNEIKGLEKKLATAQKRKAALERRIAVKNATSKMKKAVRFNPDRLSINYADSFRFMASAIKGEADMSKLPAGLMNYISPDVLSAIASGQEFKNWSDDAINSAYEGVKAMRMDAKQEKENKDAQRKNALNAETYGYYKQTYGVNGALSAEGLMKIRDLQQSMFENQEKYEDLTKGKKILHALNVIKDSIIKPQRLARQLDSNSEGIIYNRFVREAFFCDQDEQNHITQRYDAFVAKAKELGITNKHLAEDKAKNGDYLFTYKVMGKENGAEIHLTRGQAIGVYVYSQNEISRNKLGAAGGNRMGMDGTQIADIIGKLSDKDKAWGDYLIDELGGDATWERMAAVYRDVYNRELGRRDRYFTFIAENKNYEGATDTLVGPKANPVAFTDKGMTKEINEFAMYALDLDVTKTYLGQVARQEHFINWAKWVRDSNYQLNDKFGGMGTIIEQKFGSQARSTLQTYVNDIARPSTMMTDLEKLYSKALSNYAVASLAGNAMTMIKQAPSILSSIRGDIGFTEFVSAGQRLISDRKNTLEFIGSKTQDIKNRSIDQELTNFKNYTELGLASNVMSRIDDFLMKPTQLVDKQVCAQMWLAAYETGIHRGLSEDEAVFKASQLINETQPTSGPTNLSQIQRNGSPFVRSMMMFTNQIMNVMNEIYFDMPYFAKTHNIRKFVGTAASIALTAGSMVALSGAFAEPDDDKRRKKVWDQFLSQLATYTVPFVGSTIGTTFYGSGDIITMPQSIGNFARSFVQKDYNPTDKEYWEKVGSEAWDLVIDGAKASGAPTTLIKRTVTSFKEENPFYMFGNSIGDSVNL